MNLNDSKLVIFIYPGNTLDIFSTFSHKQNTQTHQSDWETTLFSFGKKITINN